jgi:hypothetical protein
MSNHSHISRHYSPTATFWSTGALAREDLQLVELAAKSVQATAAWKYHQDKPLPDSSDPTHTPMILRPNSGTTWHDQSELFFLAKSYENADGSMEFFGIHLVGVRGSMTPV